MQSVRRDCAVEEVMGGTRTLGTRLKARIAQRPRDGFLEPRRHLIRCNGRPGLEAPRSLSQRLGGSDPPRGNAASSRTRKSNAAEQRTAIEKPVAGNGINGGILMPTATPMRDAHALLL